MPTKYKSWRTDNGRKFGCDNRSDECDGDLSALAELVPGLIDKPAFQSEDDDDDNDDDFPIPRPANDNDNDASPAPVPAPKDDDIRWIPVVRRQEEESSPKWDFQKQQHERKTSSQEQIKTDCNVEVLPIKQPNHKPESSSKSSSVTTMKGDNEDDDNDNNDDNDDNLNEIVAFDISKDPPPFISEETPKMTNIQQQQPYPPPSPNHDYKNASLTSLTTLSQSNHNTNTNTPQPLSLPTFKPATGCTNSSDFLIRCIAARLRSGITIVKHGRSRWCKSRLRTLLLLPDGQTLTWKPAQSEPPSSKRPPKLDLVTCQEVRHAWSPDPLNPMFTGTPILRHKCEAANAHKSFALIFPKRTVDVTAITADQCKVLMEGLSALCYRLQLNLMKKKGKEEDEGTTASATLTNNSVGTSPHLGVVGGRKSG